MGKVFKVLFGMVAVFALYAPIVYAASSAKVTAQVVDESGVPLSGADVTIGYTLAKPGGWGTDDSKVTGKSDKGGLFTATGETIIPQVTIHARYEGYYRSSKWAKFTSRSKLLNRWEPWNPTVEVVLKKKRNPAAMYRKYLEAASIPALEYHVGYDLEKGDWVSPYGKGLIKDLVFVCQNKYESFTSAETSCEISFSNPQDGLHEYEFDQNVQSYYKWPFEAPESGYEIKKLTKWMSVHLPEQQYRSNYTKSINYLFRVRTEVDKEGNIVKANYGKIQGDIRVYKKAKVNFTYYYNPDGTRNLEYDPDKNLFKKNKRGSRSRRRR